MSKKIYRIFLICFVSAVVAVDIVFAIMTGLSATSLKAGLTFTPDWFRPFCIAVMVINPVTAILAIIYPFVSKK